MEPRLYLLTFRAGSLSHLPQRPLPVRRTIHVINHDVTNSYTKISETMDGLQNYNIQYEYTMQCNRPTVQIYIVPKVACESEALLGTELCYVYHRRQRTVRSLSGI